MLRVSKKTLFEFAGKDPPSKGTRRSGIDYGHKTRVSCCGERKCRQKLKQKFIKRDTNKIIKERRQ